MYHVMIQSILDSCKGAAHVWESVRVHAWLSRCVQAIINNLFRPAYFVKIRLLSLMQYLCLCQGHELNFSI